MKKTGTKPYHNYEFPAEFEGRMNRQTYEEMYLNP
jgi:hypothetical protein